MIRCVFVAAVSCCILFAGPIFGKSGDAMSEVDREKHVLQTIAEIDGTTLTLADGVIDKLRASVQVAPAVSKMYADSQICQLTSIAVNFAMLQAQPSAKDWDSEFRKLSVKTPHATRPVMSESVAARHRIVRGSQLSKLLRDGIYITTGTIDQVINNDSSKLAITSQYGDLPQSFIVIEIVAATTVGTTTSLRHGVIPMDGGWRLFPGSGYFASRMGQAR